MKKSIIKKVLETGLAHQADFAEVYIEESRSTSMVLKDQKIESATAGTDYGIGIRLIYGTEVLYGYTSNDDEETLIRLTKDLAQTRTSQTINVLPLSLSKKAIDNIHPIAFFPADVLSDAKVMLLHKADKAARKCSSLIRQVSAAISDSDKKITIANSEGLFISDRRIRSRFTIAVTAENKGEMFVASETPGALKGFEFFEGLDIAYHAEQAAQRALLMLDAGYIKGGKMPVVMGNAFGGVIFHEACGHPLETEAIRRNASPFVGKLNQRIAHECLTAIDDGTIANAWGSLNIDDEGMPTQKTILIENGILKNYLSDRVGAAEVGVPRTGSGRRQNYQYAPVARMRNTYIAPGKSTLDSMLASAGNGIYAKVMGGGSVNPATGEFNFSVQEAYEIKDGEIGRPVRGATLIGKGHEVLPLITMVGNDLELAAGICGASSGSIPTTVGQPSLKVDEILVGGR
ncbi:MAG: TldD/PmbA family protein [Lentisphaeraceae bacterium]|nr:TldD/PmbA family protein [Lentisphaeraceae bacterium]